MLCRATGQERIGDFILQSDRNVARLDGQITARTSTDFDVVLGKMSGIQLIQLNSPGGSVRAALEIANKVHALGLSTQVASSQDCASACSIIFLAGKQRQATGQLGVHQLSSRSPGNLESLQFAISEILDSFQKFGVDPRVIKHMLTTPPADMYYFSSFEKDDYRINRRQPATAVSIAKDQGIELKFAAFPAPDAPNGKIVLPNFKIDGAARTFRTRIRNGMKDGPNFAGHYSLIEIGCGTSCRFGILVDANTGKLVDFPLGGEENYQLEMTYTVESSLLKAVWMDTSNGKYDTCVKQDYQLRGDQLKLLEERRYTIEESGICAAYQ